MSNRLPAIEHAGRPWRIHEVVPDFDTEDVWAFHTPGAGPDDFPAMIEALRVRGGPQHQRSATRLLFAIRWRLGALLGWDGAEEWAEPRLPALYERLPRDLRQPATGQPLADTPFVMLYELQDECAYEMTNRTVQSILHLGWVRGRSGDFELRMAALVKPNGLFGRLYMAGIKPFRYLIIYPALTRQWERAWRERPAQPRSEESAGPV